MNETEATPAEVEEVETVEATAITETFIEDTYTYYNDMREYQAGILTTNIFIVVSIMCVFGFKIAKALWGK